MSTRVMVPTSESPAVAPAATDRTVRVLRWTFRRDDEEVICELGLASDYSAYELRVEPSWHGAVREHELFDDAASAFQRHAAIERRLVDSGWSLERFESQRG